MLCKNLNGKSLIISVLLVLSCISSVIANEPDQLSAKPELLFLLGGQSNMAGGGYTADLPDTDEYKAYHTPPKNVSAWNAKKKSWQPLEIGKQFGPEIGFAHALSSAHPGKHIGLVKSAAGGTSMDKWAPGGKLYTRLITVFRDASRNAPKAQLAAMLWHQGESDSDTKEVAEAYHGKMVKFVASIRKDTKEPNLLFILGQINPAKSYCGRPRFLHAGIVKKAQAELKAPNTVMIKTDDCEMNPYHWGFNTPKEKRIPKNEDNIHYSGKGQIKMGRRFAKAYQANTDSSNSMDVFLLIGQSNMAGRAPIPEEAQGVIENCMLLNGGDKWEPAKNPLNIYSTIRKGAGMQKLNPGYGFVKTMLKEKASASIGLIVNAKGGSKIGQWKKGTRFYNEALRRTKIAMKNGQLKGILWHQGESDNTNQNYLEELKVLIANLREDLGDKELPFVAGQINNVPLINDQLAQLPLQVPHTGCAKSENLKASDRWHFNTQSQIILGQRYAEAMIKLMSKK
jgi:hypothetical protein